MPDLRLFIAIPCPATRGLRALLETIDDRSRAFKTVPPDQLHLTLRFLGQTPESHVPAITSALDRAVAEARRHARDLPFTTGLTAFPPPPAAGRNRKPPKVLCLALAQPEPVVTLADAITIELASLNPPIPEPDRPFRPHLTLARLKPLPRRTRHNREQREQRAALVDQLLAEYRDTNFGSLPLRAVHLVASDLQPTGAIHRTLHAAKLPEE